MGILSGLSSIASAVTDPGKLVSEVANSILPSNMKGVGEALGGIVDFETGHPLQALSHLTDALKDLPQLAQAVSGSSNGASPATPAGTAAAEPSPPPDRTSQSSAAGSASSTPAPTPQSPKVDVQTVGRQTIISIDDGSHTTVIVDKPGQKPMVSVREDRSPTTAPSPASTTAPNTTPASTTPASTTAPGTTPASTTSASTTAPGTTPASATPASSPPASTTAGSTPSSPASASAASASSSASLAPTPLSPKVTVQRIGRETITSIDNGKRTTVIVQRPGQRPIVRTHGDTNAQLLANRTGSAKPEIIASPPTSGATSSATPAASTTTTAATSTSTPAAAGTAGGGSSATSSATDTASTSTPAATSSTSSGASSASSSATPADLQSLLAMSPDQFMQAVTSGKIPDSVANSQSAMMQVQARMNQITQMNQLVTGMMAAMHQMEMSIIQNIRC